MHKKHSKIRIFLSVAACRFTRFALRVLHRGGTTLPGRSAMFFDKTILEVVSRDMEIIVVTGTNGKTTTCKMLRHALASAKINVLSNLSGANLLTGITAEFTANASLLGHPKKHYAIVECDEGALRKVVPYLNPKCIVVTNLFRDQLDRYGEVMHTHDVIAKGIKLVPKTKLVLNADDSLTASLGENVPNPVEYYGINVPYGKQEMGEISMPSTVSIAEQNTNITITPMLTWEISTVLSVATRDRLHPSLLQPLIRLAHMEVWLLALLMEKKLHSM